MWKMMRKKVVPALLCIVLLLGFVRPYDPAMQHFSQNQLPNIMHETQQSWLIGTNFFLRDEYIEADCVTQYIRSQIRFFYDSIRTVRQEMPPRRSAKYWRRHIRSTLRLITHEKIVNPEKNWLAQEHCKRFNEENFPKRIMLYDSSEAPNLQCFRHNEPIKRPWEWYAPRYFSTERSDINYINVEKEKERIAEYNKLLSERETWITKAIGASLIMFEQARHVTYDNPDIIFYYPSKYVLCRGDKQEFDKASRQWTIILLSFLLDSMHHLEGCAPVQPILDTSAHQIVVLILIISVPPELLNPAIFKPQKWPGTASVGGIAASSPEHALSLLSVRLSAIRPFLPAGLSGESVSDSKRQKRDNRGAGTDALATI